MTSDFRPGTVWAKIDHPDIYARIDEVEMGKTENDRVGYGATLRLNIKFSVWDKLNPGWRGGAGLTLDQFRELYPTNAENIEGAPSPRDSGGEKPRLIKIRITGVYEYEVDPARAEPVYKTTDPDQILEIDRESMWEIFSEELMNGDDVVLKIERVDNGG